MIFDRGVDQVVATCFWQTPRAWGVVDMASTDQQVPTTFKCEEFDEYLLIEDAAPSEQDTVNPEQSAEPHCKEIEASLDSGYNGKHSRTGSPEEQKPNEAAAELEPEVCTVKPNEAVGMYSEACRQ